jgi:hypothetical protein
MRRMTRAVLVFCLAACACGSDGSDADQKLQTWCDSPCNFYGEDCMEVLRAFSDCTNCPEAYADQVQCHAENDCPRDGSCPLPSGCSVGSIVNDVCPPGSANNP